MEFLEKLLGVIFVGFAVIPTIISCLVSIFILVCMWRIFVKANHQGWEAIIPFYNCYKYTEIVWGEGIKFLLFLIPIANIYFSIKFNLSMAKAFNKSPLFAVGLILCSPIFLAILAFDKNTLYLGATQ